MGMVAGLICVYFGEGDDGWFTAVVSDKQIASARRDGAGFL